MHIGLVIVNLSFSGGGQRQILELANHLQGMGCRVTLYAGTLDRQACYPDRLTELNIRALHEADLRGPVPIDFPRFVLRDWVSLERLIADDLDLLNPHDSPAHWVAARWRSRTGRPVVWMCNDPAPWYFRSFSTYPLRWFAYRVSAWYDRRVVQTLDRIVVLDRRNQQLVKQHLGREAVIVRSGLDLSAFCPVHLPRGFPGGRTWKILCVGIPLRHRRFEDVLGALRHLDRRGIRDLQLDIVGRTDQDPAYVAFLKNTIAQAGLVGQVRFLGAVSESELRAHYLNADVFVFPNHQQTWGLAVFEALATGLPSIVSKTCGAAEVLGHEQEALLVDPLSPDSIAEGIQRLRGNKELYERLSARGHRFVQDNLSWRRYAADMLSEFQQTLGVVNPHAR